MISRQVTDLRASELHRKAADFVRCAGNPDATVGVLSAVRQPAPGRQVDAFAWLAEVTARALGATTMSEMLRARRKVNGSQDFEER